MLTTNALNLVAQQPTTTTAAALEVGAHHHPKPFHPHGTQPDAVEAANSVLRECWTALDDDFYLFAASLLEDGVSCTAATPESSNLRNEVEGDDGGTSGGAPSLPVEKENTTEMSAMEQVQNIIASCFGHSINNNNNNHNSQNQAPFMAFPPSMHLAPPVPATVVPAPTAPLAAPSNPPFSMVTAVPVCLEHNPMMMGPQHPKQEQHQHHEAVPFVMTNANKRLRLDVPDAAAGAGPLAQDPYSSTDSAATPEVEVKKTHAQMERRRERNRIHARRTRLRNKTAVEMLHLELMELQRENTVLKAMARIHLNESQSHKILEDCNAMENLPVSAAKACGANMLQQVVTHVKMLKAKNCLGVTDVSLQEQTSTATNPSNGYFVVTG